VQFTKQQELIDSKDLITLIFDFFQNKLFLFYFLFNSNICSACTLFVKSVFKLDFRVEKETIPMETNL